MNIVRDMHPISFKDIAPLQQHGNKLVRFGERDINIISRVF